MGVLIEALSVVVPVSVIRDRYPGGLDAFESDVPNGTFCSDGSLSRVGFMIPADVQRFVQQLQQRGLAFHDGSRFLDFAVVDQLTGPTLPCPWIEIGRHPMGFSVAWLMGTSPSPMAAPAGWTIDQSSKLHFSATDEINSRLLPLMTSDSVQAFLDFATGKEVYIGGSFPDSAH